ncbi:hypothetical protein HPB48_025952 [Haemaphysalis longicornis]|uniref:Uncharacterized protein n=1 Tax=Haemaphysalis longicornis TaxID=44386 RepID=A0A9J6GZU9_HAELO|nr:hypothetical protein HPB48_025952 [Haemaphysalis longicornis]
MNDGRFNPELDKPMAAQKVWQALEALTRHATPSKQRATNKLFINLDDPRITALRGYFNNHWERGTTPPE